MCLYYHLNDPFPKCRSQDFHPFSLLTEKRPQSSVASARTSLAGPSSDLTHRYHSPLSGLLSVLHPSCLPGSISWARNLFPWSQLHRCQISDLVSLPQDVLPTLPDKSLTKLSAPWCSAVHLPFRGPVMGEIYVDLCGLWITCVPHWTASSRRAGAGLVLLTDVAPVVAQCLVLNRCSVNICEVNSFVEESINAMVLSLLELTNF